MYYLKNEYPNNILVLNPDNSILCRFMHWDYANENDALQAAEKLVDVLNDSFDPDELKSDFNEYLYKKGFSFEEATSFSDEHFENLLSFEENEKKFLEFIN